MKEGRGGEFFKKAMYGDILRMIASIDGVSVRAVADRCEVDAATVKRAVSTLRLAYGAPISSNRSGYHWRPAPHEQRKAEALLIVFCE